MTNQELRIKSVELAIEALKNSSVCQDLLVVSQIIFDYINVEPKSKTVELVSDSQRISESLKRLGIEKQVIFSADKLNIFKKGSVEVYEVDVICRLYKDDEDLYFFLKRIFA